MTTAQHLAAIDSSAFAWRPNLASSASLVGWYEVRSDLVTQSGGACSQVNNRVAGGSNPLVQALGTAQPTYSATGWDGARAALTFDGTSDLLTANGLAAAATGTDQPFTVIWLGAILTLGSSGIIRSVWGFGKAGDDNPLHDLRLPASVDGVISSGRRDSAAVAKIKDCAAAADTSKHIYSTVFNGTKVAVWRDSVRDTNLDGTSASADNDVGALSLDTFSVGAITRAGVAGFTNLLFGGMLVYAGALSNTDRRRAERYLKLGHPF